MASVCRGSGCGSRGCDTVGMVGSVLGANGEFVLLTEEIVGVNGGIVPVKGEKLGVDWCLAAACLLGVTGFLDVDFVIVYFVGDGWVMKSFSFVRMYFFTALAALWITDISAPPCFLFLICQYVRKKKTRG